MNEQGFLSMMDAQEKVEIRRRDYDSRKPDSSLGNAAPEEFVRRQQNTEAGHAGPDGGRQLIVNKQASPPRDYTSGQVSELHMRLEAGDSIEGRFWVGSA